MSARPYLLVSGFIFFFVGLLHLVRLLNHWPAQVGGMAVPQWLSYLGFPIAWGLSLWASLLYRRRGLSV